MDFNKVGAGILAAGIAFVATLIVAENIFSPDKLDKQAYIVDTGAVQTATTQEDAKPIYLMGEEFEKLVSAGDASKGEVTFKKCVACHSNTQDGANKVGPNLWGIFERKIASNATFTYSDALKGLKGNWTIDSLNGWLHNPREYAKGNRMGFIGIKDDKERANIIAYLKTLR